MLVHSAKASSFMRKPLTANKRHSCVSLSRSCQTRHQWPWRTSVNKTLFQTSFQKTSEDEKEECEVKSHLQANHDSHDHGSLWRFHGMQRCYKLVISGTWCTGHSARPGFSTIFYPVSLLQVQHPSQVRREQRGWIAETRRCQDGFSMFGTCLQSNHTKLMEHFPHA